MALRVKPCSHQDGKARYSGAPDDRAPDFAPWRNNLTALSQYRNLLFVAYLDRIHVFEPVFPSQTLPKKPALIIAIPESRPGLPGYIAPDFPHAINHLIIGEIGNEEVLVACCDDGDVVGYTVRSIERLVETLPDLRRQSKLSSRNIEPVPTVPGRPFLLENVGDSAWGLATHKTQRLLAVSSNTSEICIFVFALGLPNIDMKVDNKLAHLEIIDEPFLSDDKLWPRKRNGSPKDRSKNTMIVLSLHNENIPNIAFYDSDRDGQETYLASIDIGGRLLIWEIWSGVAIVDMAIVPGSSALTGARGWGLACIDPRISQLTQSQEDTYGCTCLTDIGQTFLDITRGARSVPDNSVWHPAFSRLVPVPLPTYVPPQHVFTVQQPEISQDVEMEDADETDVADEGSDEEVLGEPYNPENEGQASTDGTITDNQAEGEDDHDDDSEESEDSQATEEFPYDSLLHPANDPHLPGDILINTARHRRPLKPSHQFSWSPEVRETLQRTAIIPPPLPFSLLHTTEMDIHLWRNIAPRSDRKINVSSGLQSRVICRKAIQQAIPPNVHHLQYIERLNMVLQIPELGIVAVGNQAGRVGLLTMTRWQHCIESGFKIEFILPFHSQEGQGLRPERPLLGIAIGPIQGHETKPDDGSALETSDATATGPRIATRSSRRFRLMMLYYDHTLLSYEISRESESDELLVV